MLAVAVAVLTGLLPPAKAYAGFRERHDPADRRSRFWSPSAVVKCGLGTRVGHLIVSVLRPLDARSAYSIFLVDGVIAPAFPSNTARSGVLYPLAFSLADAAGATPDDAGAPARSARFLMFSGIVSLSLSSALWLTAMAANPLGAEIARALRRRDRVRLVAARRVACRR